MVHECAIQADFTYEASSQVHVGSSVACEEVTLATQSIKKGSQVSPPGQHHTTRIKKFAGNHFFQMPMAHCPVG